MQTRLFEVKKPVEPVEAVDPDYFERESTAAELAARQRVREMMFSQGWKLIYPKVKSEMMECRYCGSDQVEYHGAVDGAGDYGEAVCDEYECLDCGNLFDGDCIGSAVDGVIEDDEPEFDQFLIDNGLMRGPDDDVIDVGEIPF